MTSQALRRRGAAVFVTAEDSSAVAVATMRDRGLKKLPVITGKNDQRLIGYLRVERIMEFVMQRIRGSEESVPLVELQSDY